MASRLRKDLVATTGDDQGVACVEVTDPSSGTSFRFYDFEYALAQQLTGQSLEEVAAWASATYGIELTPETLNEFIEKLAGLGFLTDAGAQPAILAPYAPSPGSFSSGELAANAFSDVPTQVGDVNKALPADKMLGETEDGAVDEAIALLGSQEHALAGPPQEGALDSEPPPEIASGPWVTVVPPAPPREPDQVLPRLEVLASPLPPVVPPAEPGEAQPALSSALSGTAAVRSGPGVQSPAGLAAAVAVPVAPARPTPGAGMPVTADTPLASITRAIAESTAPPPPGAIDIGGAAVRPEGTTARIAGPAVKNEGAGVPAHSSNAGVLASAGSSGRASDQSSNQPSHSSWASDLDRAVDGGAEPGAKREERAQPLRPEVVVMPPMAQPAPAPSAPPRRGWLAFLGVLIVGGGLAAAVWFMRPTEGPPAAASSSAEAAPLVHAVSPQPTTFYGWFETAGVVVPGQDQALAFHVGGRVQEVMPPGTTFVAGDIIARLQGAAERDLIVNRLRSRIAYLEQLRDSSRSEGTEAAARQAEAKLTVPKQQLANAQAALEDLIIRPKVAGMIAEVMTPKGSLIKAGTVVLRARSTAPRATFGFSADEAARARALAFCRLETIPGTGAAIADTGGAAGEAAGTTDAGTPDNNKTRAVDCALPVPPAAAGQLPESRVSVDFVGAPTLVIGTQVRLASARYDGVFPVPRSAVVREGDVDHVWIVSGGGRFAERRTVELAATVDALALVAHGIAVGDAVVIDAPATLKAGGEINVVR